MIGNTYGTMDNSHQVTPQQSKGAISYKKRSFDQGAFSHSRAEYQTGDHTEGHNS
jgi:hypothetical protein